MLRQKVIVQYASNFGLRLLGAIGGIFVARYAGVEVMGTLAYALAYVNIFGFVTGIFGTGHLKLVSEGQPLGKCMGTFGRLQSASIIFYIILVLSWFLSQKYLFGHQFESKDVEIVIWLYVFMNAIDYILQSVETTYTARLQQVKANLPKVLNALLWNIGRILIAILGYKAITLASWNLLSSLMVLPLIILMLRKLPWGGWDSALAKRYISYSIPVILIVAINAIVGASDKLILKHYTSTTELGYYAAAFVVGGFILQIGSTIGQLFFPLFSKYIANGDWESVRRRIFQYEEFLLVFIFPIVTLLALIAEPIILIMLGKGYSPSITPFSILAIATFFVIWLQPYGNVINGKGLFYMVALIKFLKLLFYIASIFFFLSPQFLGLGSTGLALNQFAVGFFEVILSVIFAYKIGKVRVQKEILIIFFIILIIGGIGYFSIPMIKPIGQFWWMIFTPIYLGAVYGILFIFGFFGKRNIIQFVEILNLKTLTKYIKQELKKD